MRNREYNVAFASRIIDVDSSHLVFRIAIYFSVTNKYDSIDLFIESPEFHSGNS